MGHIDAADREKLLSSNVTKLYQIEVAASLPDTHVGAAAAHA
jgi:hypothetical protein